MRRRTWGHRGGVWDWGEEDVHVCSRPIPTLRGGRAVSVHVHLHYMGSRGTVASSVTEMMLIGNAAADAI